MDRYFNNDEHHEDQLPPAPYPPLIRRINDDNYEKDLREPDRSSGLLEKWRNLYETSLHSLQSDDNDQPSFFINRQVTPEKPPSTVARVFPREERPYSPVNESKSKWEIRLPTLLNSMVGPDRQTRNVTRRHTTNVVFEPWNSENVPFNPDNSFQTFNGTNANESVNPLVKQLKLKFDRMILNNSTNNIFQASSTASPRFHRTASLTSRDSSVNTSGRLIQKPRSVLPIRSSANTPAPTSGSDSSSILNQQPAMSNGRSHRGRAGPPLSYSRHYYPPPSTTSVVKQLIGSGATLVYDSRTPQSAGKAKSLMVKRDRSLDQTRKALQDTDTTLTARQLPPKSSGNGYAKVKPKENVTEPKSDEENIYERMSPRSSMGSSGRKANPTRRSIEDNASDIYYEPEVDPSGNKIAPTTTDDNDNYYPVYDTSQWRDDDDAEN